MRKNAPVLPPLKTWEEALWDNEASNEELSFWEAFSPARQRMAHYKSPTNNEPSPKSGTEASTYFKYTATLSPYYYGTHTVKRRFSNSNVPHPNELNGGGWELNHQYHDNSGNGMNDDGTALPDQNQKGNNSGSDNDDDEGAQGDAKTDSKHAKCNRPKNRFQRRC